jgi:ubiquinone biosynthesis protein
MFNSAKTLFRLIHIQKILVEYGLDSFLKDTPLAFSAKLSLFFHPNRWLSKKKRNLPRGQRIRLALEALGPIYIKFGQILSTRRDLLPDDIANELAKLQDQVPAFDNTKAVQIIEKELGDSIENLFQSFSKTPLASASIAQVHEATMFDGRDVVVKVLRPNILPLIKRDISVMMAFAKLLQTFWPEAKRLEPVAIVGEFEKTILNELDLRKEAANGSRLHQNFEGSDILIVPEMDWEHSQKNVLVMEKIEGIKMTDMQIMKDLGVDMKCLAERGVEVFFTQVFRDNFFHADMHPGNIFVNVDDPKKPVWMAVDFGIVGSLSKEDQHYLAENFLAFFKRDYRRVAELHVESAWVGNETRVEDFELAIRSVCEPIFKKPLAEISFGLLLINLFQTARQFDMHVQPQLVLLQKTLLNIEGLGRQIYPELNLWDTALPYLEKWIKLKTGPIYLLEQLQGAAPKYAQMIPEMPDLIHKSLVALGSAQNQLNQQTKEIADLRKTLVENQKNNKFALVGVACLISAAIIFGLDGHQPAMWGGVPKLSWVLVAVGVYSLLRK